MLVSVISGLWGLVNNAGVCYFADLEMTSEIVFKKIFDINLFGAVRITKSLLPLIRKAKGRIVNVSSLLGKSYEPHSVEQITRVFEDNLGIIFLISP